MSTVNKQTTISIILCICLCTAGLHAQDFEAGRYRGGSGSGFVVSDPPLANQDLEQEESVLLVYFSGPGTLRVYDADETLLQEFSSNGYLEIDPYDLAENPTQLTLKVIPDENHRFDGWPEFVTVSESDPLEATIAMNLSRTLNLSFIELATLTVNRSPSAGGEVNLVANGDPLEPNEPEGNQYTVDKGSSLGLQAEPNTHYRFNNWSGNVSTIQNTQAAHTTIVMNGDYTISANFLETVELTLTPAPAGGGSLTVREDGTTIQPDSPGGSVYTVDRGSPISITAMPGSNFRFDGYTGDLGGVANPQATAISFVINNHRHITANFVEEVTFTIYVFTEVGSNGGTVSAFDDADSSPLGTWDALGSVKVDKGTVIRLEASPSANYRFEGWSENVNVETELTGKITMNNNRTVFSYFTEVTSLTVNLAPGSTGTVSLTLGGSLLTPDASGGNTYTVERFSEVALLASPVENFRFGNWTGDVGTLDDPSANDTYIYMNNAYTIQANFVETVKLSVTNISPAHGNVRVLLFGQELALIEGAAGEVVIDKLGGTRRLTLKAEPEAGYHFAGWTGDHTSYNAVTEVTMNDHKAVSVDFWLQTAAPELSIPPGHYSTAQTLGLTSGTSGASIHYRYSDNMGADWSEWLVYSSGFAHGNLNPDTDRMFEVYASATDYVDSDLVAGHYIVVSRFMGGGGSGFTVADPLEKMFLEWTTLHLVHEPPETGVTLTGAGDYNAGDVVALNATANDPEAYDFYVWTDADGRHLGTDAAYDFTMPTHSSDDITLTAVFIEAGTTFHPLTLLASGHGVAEAEGGSPYPSGQPVLLTATPLVNDVFLNWTRDGVQVSGDAVFAFGMPAEEVTLYANFIHHSITPYVLNATSSNPLRGAVSGGGSYAPGTTVPLTAHAADHYIFSHWSGDTEHIENIHHPSVSVTMNGNYNFQAHFIEAVSLDLTVSPAESGQIRVNENTPGGRQLFFDSEGTLTIDKKDGSRLLVLTAVAGEGNAFLEWTGDVTPVTDTMRATIVMDHDYSAQAVFLPQVVAPVFSPSGGNFFNQATISLTTETAGVNIYYRINNDPQGDPEWQLYTEAGFQLPADTESRIEAYATKAGYADSEISEGIFSTVRRFTGGPGSGFHMNSLENRFLQLLVLTLEDQPGQSSEFLDGAGSFEAGTTVPVSTAAKDGHVFYAWIHDGSHEAYEASFNYNTPDHSAEPVTLTAWFTPADPALYHLNLSNNGPGISSYSGDSPFPAGIPVALSASPAPGTPYRFLHWTHNDVEFSSDPNHILTMPEQNLSLTAWFIPSSANTFNLSLTSGNPAGGSVTGSGTYREGREVPITATINENYRFDGWSGDIGEVFDPSEPATWVAIHGNYSIEASFVQTVSLQLVLLPDATAGHVEIWEDGRRLHPDDNGLLVIDKQGGLRELTLRAVPVEGNGFHTWTDNVTVNPQNPMEATIIMDSNQNVQARFRPKVEPPVFSLASGGYSEPQTMTISHPTGATIHYRISYNMGQTWTTDWTVYGSQTFHLELDQDVRFEAYGSKDMHVNSDVAVAQYSIVRRFAGGPGSGFVRSDTLENKFLKYLNLVLTDHPEGSAQTLTGDGNYDSGAAALLTASANAGYEFYAWSDNFYHLSYDAAFTYETPDYKAGTHTLTALFIEPETDRYPLTVDVNLGQGAANAGGVSPYPVGALVGLQAIPDQGHAFLNWTRDGYQISMDPNHIYTMPPEDVSLHANFYHPPSTTLRSLTINNTPHEAGMAQGQGTYVNGTSVHINALPETGYRFDRWSGDVSTIADVRSASTTIVMNGDYEITAHYVPVYYLTTLIDPEARGNVIVKEGDRVIKTIESSGVYTIDRLGGTRNLSLVAEPEAGYAVSAWGGDAIPVEGNPNLATLVMDGNKNISAIFLPQVAAIVFDPEPGYYPGLTAVGITTVTPGATIHYRTSANYGSNWNDWQVLGGTSLALPTDAEITIQAYASLAEYASSHTVEGFYSNVQRYYGGAGSGFIQAEPLEDQFLRLVEIFLVTQPEDAHGDLATQSGEYKYEAGSTATLVANPAPDYEFVNWILDGYQLSGELTFDFVLPADNNEDITIQGWFVPEGTELFMVNLTTGGSGSTTGQGTYPENFGIHLNATPANDWVFVNWTLNGAQIFTEPNWNFPMPDAHLFYRANFAHHTTPLYSLDINIAPGNHCGSAIGAGTYAAGTLVYITAEAEDGWAFDHWSGSENFGNANNAHTTLLLDQAMAITANYLPQVASPTFSHDDQIIYTEVTPIEIGTTTEGASIRYRLSTDGGQSWDTEWLDYAGPIDLPLLAETTIQAYGHKTDWADSERAQATYVVTGQVEPVVFDPDPAGIYVHSLDVYLETPTEESYIEFKTSVDGIEWSGWVSYTGVVTLTNNTTTHIRARALRTDWAVSEVSEAVYQVHAMWFVKEDGNDGNAGLSWSEAFATLQHALDVATDHHKIWIAGGTYKPTIDHGLAHAEGVRGNHFRLKNKVSVYGGFAGTEDPSVFELSERDFALNPSVLSGDLNSSGSLSGNAFHVFYHPYGLNLDETAVLDGVTITMGNAGNLQPHNMGGGMHNDGSSPTLRNIHFKDNYAANLGGALYSNEASPRLVNIIFSGNEAFNRGGALYISEGSPVIINSLIHRNTARFGAGVFSANNAQAKLINVTIADNHATERGGGIASFNGAHSFMTNTIIYANSAGQSDGHQLYNFSNGNMTLTNSLFGNSENDVVAGDAPIITSGCMHFDPMFVSHVYRDYRLLGISDAIDAGTNAPYGAEGLAHGINTDLSGRNRRVNGVVDMGAYEWQVDDPMQIVQTPVFSYPGGTYAHEIGVEITSDTPDVTIYYCLVEAGQDCDIENFVVYNQESVVTIEQFSMKTLLAYATKPGFADSRVAEADYLITGKVPLELTKTGQGSFHVRGENGQTIHPDQHGGTTYTVDYGSTLRIDALPVASWRFDSWSGTNEEDLVFAEPEDLPWEAEILMDTQYGKELHVTFIELVTLTTLVEGNGTFEVFLGEELLQTDDGKDNEYTVDVNTHVELLATPGIGWLFNTWEGSGLPVGGITDPDQPQTASLTLTASQSAKAIYEISQVRPVLKILDVELEGLGTVSVTKQGEAFLPETVDEEEKLYTFPLVDYGTELVFFGDLNQELAEGWILEWEGDIASNLNPVTVTMAMPEVTQETDMNIVAVFSNSEYSLQISRTGLGTVTVTASIPNDEEPPIYGNWEVLEPVRFEHDTWTYIIKTHSHISMEAAPAENYRFEAWSSEQPDFYIDPEAPRTATLTMNRNRYADVEFVERLTLHMDIVDVAGGTVAVDTLGAAPVVFDAASNALIMDAGRTVSLTAIPDPLWRFDGFTGDIEEGSLTHAFDIYTNTFTTANFIRQYELLLSSLEGEGQLRVDSAEMEIHRFEEAPESLRFDTGTELRLVAEADYGWQFAQWTGDLSAAGTITGTLTMDADKDIGLAFERMSFSLTVNTEGTGSVGVENTTNPGSSGSESPYTALYEDMMRLTATAVGSANFIGFSGDMATNASPADLEMDATKEVTAHFSETQYSLAITIDGGGEVLVQQDGEEIIPMQAGNQYLYFADHNSALSITAIGVPNWRFGHWNGNTNDYDPVKELVLNENKAMTAHFIETVPIQFVMDGDGIVNFHQYDELLTARTGSGVVHADKGVELRLEAEDIWGWEFTAWGGADVGDLVTDTRSATITPEEGKQLTAHFERLPFNLTITTAGDGEVKVYQGATLLTPENGTYTLLYGTNLTLVAEAGDTSGNRFIGFSGDHVDNNATTALVMDGHKAVEATFSTSHNSLLATVNEGGGIEVRAGTHIYEPEPSSGNTYIYYIPTGTVLDIEATADAHWRFQRYTGSLSGYEPLTSLTLQFNEQFAVEFHPTVTLYLATNPAASGTARVISQVEGEIGRVDLGGGDYSFTMDKLIGGHQVEIEAEPAANWRFDHWAGADAGELDEVNAPLTGITMNTHKNITLNNVQTVSLDLTQVGSGGQVSIYHGGELLGSTNAGTMSTVVTIDKNLGDEVFDLLANPVGKWRFDGYTEGLLTEAATASITMDANKEVTATFIQLFTLITGVHNLEGGSVSVSEGGLVLSPDESTPNEYTVDTGTILGVEALPEAAYGFKQWLNDLGGDTNPADVAMDADKQVTAEFERLTFDITIVKQGAAANQVVVKEGGAVLGHYVDGAGNAIYTVEYGTNITLEAHPAASWRFDKWSGGHESSSETSSLSIYEDKVITAEFVETVTLEISRIGTGQVAVDGVAYTSVLTIDKNETVNMEAIAASGWRLLEWSGQDAGSLQPVGESGIEHKTLLMDGHKKIAARFIEIFEVIVEVDPVGFGQIIIDGNTETPVTTSITLTLDMDTELTLKAVSLDDKGFVAWQDGQGEEYSTEAEIVISVSGALHYTATFDETWILDLHQVGAGGALQVRDTGWQLIDPDEPDGHRYTFNRQEPHIELNLEAIPDQYWRFDQWTGLEEHEAYEMAVFNLDKNATVTGTFVEQVNLQVNVDGQGAVKVERDGTEIGYFENNGMLFLDKGEGTPELALTAIPDAGWAFDPGWSGGLSGTMTETTLVMDESSKQVTAAFSITTVTLTITKPADVGQVLVIRDNLPMTGQTVGEETTYVVDYGTSLTLFAQAGTDEVFVRWSGPGAADIASPTLTYALVQMNGDRDITAEFIETRRLSISRQGVGDLYVDGVKHTTGSMVIEKGQTVLLVADPGFGWKFDKWGGNDVNDITVPEPGTPHEAQLTMTDDKSIIVHFIQAVDFDLYLSPVSGGVVSITGGGIDGSYAENTSFDNLDIDTEITLQASANENFEFVAWIDKDGDVVQPLPPPNQANSPESIQYSLHDSGSLTAVFKAVVGVEIHIYGEGEIEVYDLNTGDTERFTESGIFYTELTDPAGQLELYALPATGWRFGEWTGASVSTDTWTFIEMNAHQTVTATFIEQVRLDLDIVGEGQVTVKDGEEVLGTFTESGSLVYDKGSVGPALTLIAEPDLPGWEFNTGWSGDLTGNTAQESLQLDQNRTVTATFDVKQMDMTITVNGAGGSVTVRRDGLLLNPVPDNGTEVYTVNYGDLLTFSSQAESGWKFKNWTGNSAALLDDAEAPDSYLEILDDHQLTANFVETYNLSLISITGSGSVVINGTTYTGGSVIPIEKGTTANLEALANMGWKFNYWDGANASDIAPDINTPTATIVMSGPKSIAARFVESRSFRLTVQNGGTVHLSGPEVIDGNITGPGEAYYDDLTLDTYVELEATSDPEYEFVSWTDQNGNVLAPLPDNPEQSTSTLTYMLDNSVEITANFVRVVRLQLDILGGGGTVEVFDGEGLWKEFTESGTLVLETDGVNHPVLTLDAFSGSNWRHEEWGGVNHADLNYGDPISTATITMDTDKEISATFVESALFHLTMAGSGNGTVTLKKGDETLHTFTSSQIIILDKGFTYTLVAQTDLESNSFIGWSGDHTSSESETSISFGGNTNITATFDLRPMELRLGVIGAGCSVVVRQGGVVQEGVVSGDDMVYTVNHGANLLLQAVPCETMAFDRWDGADVLDIQGDPQDEFVAIEMTDNKALEAHFKEVYTLTVQVSGSGSVKVDGETYLSSVTVDKGTVMKLEAIPGLSHKFNKWTGDVSGTETATFYIQMDQNKTVSAQFIQSVDFTLYIVPSAAGSVYVSGDGVEDGDYSGSENAFADLDMDTELTLSASAYEGYEFVAWVNDQDVVIGELPGKPGQSTATITYSLSGTGYLRAEYRAIHTLNIHVVGEGTVYVDGTEYTSEMIVDAGAYLELSAVGAESWRFAFWEGEVDDHLEAMTFIDMNAPKTVTVTFVEQVSLGMDISPLYSGNVTVKQGLTTLTPQGGVYRVDKGSFLGLEATPESNFRFKAWAGANWADVGDHLLAETTILMDANKLLLAEFQATRNLTLHVNGGGGSVLVDGVAYGNGSHVIPIDQDKTIGLVADPAAGWRFEGWDGHLIGDNTTESLIMDGHKVVTADFVGMVNLTIGTEGIGSVKVNGTTYTETLTFDSGELITLEAEPGMEHVFSHWSGSLDETDNPVNFYIHADKAITAHFTQQYTLSLFIDGNGGVKVNDGVSHTESHQEIVFNSGAVVDLEALPNTGWKLLEWSGALTGEVGLQSITMDANKTVTATFEEVLYGLTLSASPSEGGSVIGTGSFTFNASVEIIANAEEGWEFVNWTRDNSDINLNATDFYTMPAENVHLVANFTQGATALLTLQRNPTAGGNVSGGGTYPIGTTVPVSASVNNGYTFINWTKDTAEGVEESAQASFNYLLDAASTLVANFEINTHSLTLTAEPELGGALTGAGSYDFNTMVDIGAIVNDGYEFVRWREGEGTISTQTNTFYQMPDRDAHLVAVFNAFDYTLSLEISPEGGGTVEDLTGQVTYNAGQKVQLRALPNEGYTFGEWKNGEEVVSTDAEFEYTMPAENTTLTAHFDPITYTVALYAEPDIGGSTGGGGSYTVGEPVTITASPAEGYFFVNWMQNGVMAHDAPEYGFNMPPGNVSFTATFALSGTATYTLTLEADPALAGSLRGAGTYVAGMMIDLGVETNDGYSFIQWEDEGGLAVSLTDGRYEMPAAHTTLTARFGATDYSLTLNVDPAAAATASGAGNNYNAGQMIPVGLDVNDGYTFLHWENEAAQVVSTDADFDFEMPAGNVTLTARFEAIDYTLTLLRAPDAGGSVSGGGVFKVGDPVSAQANVNAEYTFINWMMNGAEISTANPYDFNMPAADVTLTATFMGLGQQTFTLSFDDDPPGTAASFSGAGTYVQGTDVWISATPASGYTFREWTDLGGAVLGDPTAATTTVTMSADYTLTANMEPMALTLTVFREPSIGGSVKVNDAAYSVPVSVGYMVENTIEAIPASGYRFDRWTYANGELVDIGEIGDPLAATTSLTLTTSQTIVAHFVRTVNLTLTINGTGEVKVFEGETLLQSFTENGGLTIDREGGNRVLRLEAAETSVDFRFGSWSGAVSGEEPNKEITMSSNRSVTANYIEQIRFTLDIVGTGTVTVAGVGHALVTQDIVVDINTILPLNATPADSWRFNRWEGDIAGSNPVSSINMSAPKAVTAVFTQVVPLTIKADDQSIHYGDDEPALSWTITHGELAGGDQLSGSLVRQAGADAGTYEIHRGTLDAGFDYDIGFVTGTFTIDPRPITVTAKDLVKNWGTADPSLTYEEANVLLQDDPTGALAREPGEWVGTYTITMNTLDYGSNYSVTFNPGYLSIESDDYIWIGSNNGAKNNGAIHWHVADYWNQRKVPDKHSNVIIPENPLGLKADSKTPAMIMSDAHALNITIQGNNYLALDAGTALTVHGYIDNTASTHPNHGILIVSDATGTGSLIHYQQALTDKNETAPVMATVQRYISGDPMAWHQLSTPVAEQRIVSANKSASNFGDGSLFAWFEPAQTWVSARNTSAWPTWGDVNRENPEHFFPGRGYMVAYPYLDQTGGGVNQTKEFEGALNFGDFRINLLDYAHPNDAYKGFNFVGNPFAASVDWKHTSWDQQVEGMDGQTLRCGLMDDGDGYTIWIWNHETGSYGAYNSASIADKGTSEVTRFIPPMQGFWVRSDQHGSRMTMTNEVRAHSTQEWMKQLSNPPGVLRMQVSSQANRFSDEIVVEFGHRQSEGGAPKMFSLYEDAPALYTTKDGAYYSINFLTSTQQHPLVPLAFDAGADSFYTITAEGAETFREDVILKDLHTGITHNLKYDNTYHFEAAVGDAPDRFLLFFGNADETQITEPDEMPDPVIYYHDGILYVSNPWQSTALIQVFNISGSSVISGKIPAMHNEQMIFQAPPGVYIVRMGSTNSFYTTRVVVGR